MNGRILRSALLVHYARIRGFWMSVGCFHVPGLSLGYLWIRYFVELWNLLIYEHSFIRILARLSAGNVDAACWICIGGECGF